MLLTLSLALFTTFTTELVGCGRPAAAAEVMLSQACPRKLPTPLQSPLVVRADMGMLWLASMTRRLPSPEVST
jgi:hypothetical protein